MGMIADLFVKLGLKSDEFNRGLDDATKKTNVFSSTLKSIGGAIAGAFAVSSLFSFAKSAVMGYDQAQQAATRLLTALNGNVKVQKELIKQAGQLQKTTLYEDDVTVSAQALVAMFVKEESAIKRLIPLIQDFATAKQMDLNSAANLVSKSIGSNVNALTRYGIEIEGAAGSSERLEMAITKLNEKVGGQAAAAAAVGIGSLKQLALAWDSIKDAIGGVIVESNAFKNSVGYLSTISKIVDANLSSWQKFVLVMRIGGAGAEDERKKVLANAEAVDRYMDNLNKFDPKPVYTLGITQKILTDTEIYNKRLEDLKNKANAAKQALQFAGPKDDIAALGDAFDTANTALKNFLETTKKVKRETGSIAPMVGGKSPFKFGAGTPQSQTTVDEKTGLFTDMSSQDAAIAAGAGLDMKSITSSLAANKEQLKTALSEFISPVQDFNNQLNSLIQQGMMDAATSFGEGLGALMSGDMNMGEFGMSLLGVVGDFIKQLGQLFIATAIGMIAFDLGLKSMNPFVMLGAGVALVAAGSAVSNFAKGGLSGTGGGGGYSAASGYSGSSGMSSASNMLQGNVVFELQGTTLKGVLNNTDRKNKNIR